MKRGRRAKPKPPEYKSAVVLVGCSRRLRSQASLDMTVVDPRGVSYGRMGSKLKRLRPRSVVLEGRESWILLRYDNELMSRPFFCNHPFGNFNVLITERLTPNQADWCRLWSKRNENLQRSGKRGPRSRA